MPAIERGVAVIRQWGREIFGPARLLIAIKAAAAAVIAWFVAAILPGSLDEYRYYAPLGAIISMSPTLVRSVKAGVETLIGIGIAWLTIITPAPGLLALFLAVSVGVLIAGINRLGAGRDYVPVAALFVIVVGGSDAEDYSLGFLVQMAVGAAIGFFINIVVAPPLALRSSSRQFSSLRDQTADLFEEIAKWLQDPSADRDWMSRYTTLREEVESAEFEVDEARESRRLNPRAMRGHYDAEEDRDGLLLVLEIIDRTGRLSESLEDLQESLAEDEALRELRSALSRTLHEFAEALRVFRDTTTDADVRSARQAAAADAVESLDQANALAKASIPGLHANVGAAVTELGRISALLTHDERE